MKRSSVMLGTVCLGLAVAVLAAPPEAVTITAARTAADHEAIAQAYESEAASLEKMAAMHKNLGDTYASQAGGKALHVGQAKHCQSVAQDLAAAAKEERALAAEHHSMAKSAGK